MKTNLDFTKNTKTLIMEMKNDNVKFEIFEWEELKGGGSISDSVSLFFLKEGKVTLKEAKITLNNSSVNLEAGALYYQKGDLEIESKAGGVLGLGKKLLKSMATGETVFKPKYTGTGEITLEPTFGHYALVELENETIIVDDGVFYACEAGIEVGAAAMKNISSAALGGEGLFQTKLSGSGIVLLEIPVPQTEIIEYKLENDTLKVDGNFAILRNGNINFTVEKSTKSLIGSATSGEGLLNVYRGTGIVWLVPTKPVYDSLRYFGISGMSNPGGTSNTKV
jgi:uncharacterized protein (AIM24 family)